MNKLEILRFIKDSIKWLKKTDCGCCHLNLDDDLAIFVGWTDGFDKSDPAVIHSKSDKCYAIEVGVKIRRDGDDADYEWLDFPWNTDGDCIDNCFNPTPSMTNKAYLNEIDTLLSTYHSTVEEHKNGYIKYEY